jgi:hypothetical protein
LSSVVIVLSPWPHQSRQYRETPKGVSAYYEPSFGALSAHRFFAAALAISFRRAGESFLLRIATIACAIAFFFLVAIVHILAYVSTFLCYR